MHSDLEMPRLFTLREAAASGVNRHRLATALERGEIRRVARGLYVRDGALGEGEPWQLLRRRHLHRCAELLVRHRGHTASHQTAALVHGLELPIHPDMDVHLTAVERVPRTQRFPGVQLHHADSVENETETVSGLRVTTLARTLADVLRTSRPPFSVAVLDAAVRDGRIRLTEVAQVLATQRRWRGRPRAREALELHDPRRESWLESYSFVRLHALGIPLPLPQVEVLDAGFHLVGRVDGFFPRSGTFLEADGAGKYFLAALDGTVTAEDASHEAHEAQARRHAALVNLGLTGARWTTTDIMQQPEVVAARVRGAMDDGDPSRFRGWLRFEGTVLGIEALRSAT